jgi:hypothetical protein
MSKTATKRRVDGVSPCPIPLSGWKDVELGDVSIGEGEARWDAGEV